MSFDGILMHGLIKEVNSLISGGRITKIQMPSTFEIIFTVRNQRKNFNLELSIHPQYQRLNLTSKSIQSPSHPYPFTMILRKYLQGAQIRSIEQFKNDRIILIQLSNINDLGDRIEYLISAEMLGRQANVIIINQKSKKIIDSLKHENIDKEGKRVILPNLSYELPKAQQELNPFDFGDIDKSKSKLTFPLPTEKNIKEFLNYFQGLGKDTKKELTNRMLNNNPAEAWKTFFDQVNHPTPTIYYDDQKQPINFTAIPYKTICYNSTQLNSFSELLEKYFHEKSTFSRNKQAAQKILTHINSLLKKDQRKLKNLSNDLIKAEKADEFRIKGDLITIHLHEIKSKKNKVTFDNYYQPGEKITIKLDPEISPSQNAQKYYKKYHKLQNSRKYIKQQIEATRTEISYFETIITQINFADYSIISEIKQELIKEKYLKLPNKGGKNTKNVRTIKSRPLTFKAKDGTQILVGRNNSQNDHLSLHDAQKSDYWLHTKNIPGSHVIIKNSNPSEETLIEAAMIAAYYSKSRHSAQVPVDYVPVKKLKKPKGSKPGFVTFTGQKTLFVTPNETLIDHLKS